jgi:hypothetical protein
VSIFDKALALCSRKTSRVIELFFMYSLVNMIFDVVINGLISALAIVLRFVLVSALLVAFSEEPFWLEAKRNSAVCAYIRRIIE